MALFMHTPATLRDLEAALEEFRSRIEAVAGQLEAARIDEPLGIDYQVRVEKALEGLNAFCATRKCGSGGGPTPPGGTNPPLFGSTQPDAVDPNAAHKIIAKTRVAFRSELLKKWGLAPSPYAYDRENHANARCLSPFFHKRSARDATFAERKATFSAARKGPCMILGSAPYPYLILFAVSVVAGAINAVAGGGTLLTFPSLLWAGRLSEILANATSTVALWPGQLGSLWGYRSELGRGRKTIRYLAVPSFLGGLIGAVLLLAHVQRDVRRPGAVSHLVGDALVHGPGAAVRWQRRRAALDRMPGEAGR